MSLLEQKHDEALLRVPWLTKETKSGRWLFKYAPHPDRAGYVFVATDLIVLLFESLTAPSIPARLAKMIPGSTRTRVTESQRDDTDTAERALKVLDTLENEIMVLSSSWNDVEVEVKEDGFYDRVVSVKASISGKPFAWLFNMAELRSTIPLAFITRHLIGPMASHFAPQSVVPSSQSPLAAIAVMLEDSDLAKRISGPGSSTSVYTSNDHTETQQTAYSETLAPASSTLKSASPEANDEHSPILDGLEDIQEEEEEEEEDNEAYQSSNAPSPAHTRSHDKPISEVARETRSFSPEKPSSDKTTSEAGPAKQPKQPTPTPFKPSVSQSSQKSKREREKEEEESMEKRLEEVRRKMGPGGGGRLSRRRAGR